MDIELGRRRAGIALELVLARSGFCADVRFDFHEAEPARRATAWGDSRGSKAHRGRYAEACYPPLRHIRAAPQDALRQAWEKYP